MQVSKKQPNGHLLLIKALGQLGEQSYLELPHVRMYSQKNIHIHIYMAQYTYRLVATRTIKKK